MIRSAIRSVLLFLGVVFIATGISHPGYSVSLVLAGSCLLGIYSGTAR